MKLIETERPEGTFFGLPLEEGSKDILIMRRHDGIVEAYLTDKSGNNRDPVLVAEPDYLFYLGFREYLSSAACTQTESRADLG